VNPGAVPRREAGSFDDSSSPATHLIASDDGTVVRSPREASSVYYAAKRAVDLIGSLLLILVVLPLVPFIVAGILLDTGGPILYSQQRVRARRVRIDGEWLWRLEPFTFLKFRTMHNDAPSDAHEAYMSAYIAGDEEKLALLQPDNSEGANYKLHEDPRVTRFGRILRSTSLDELPQLVNVLVGQMSLVGPRPPIPYEVAMYRLGDMVRFASPAGITGLWQVSGRSDLSFNEMIALDVEYIRERSVLFDLRILLQTIPVVFSREGAG
jgi:lipopolysaccharide/colanic/teichoic acid biosynthesis glycosyltransferase